MWNLGWPQIPHFNQETEAKLTHFNQETEAKLMLCWFWAKHLGSPMCVLRGAPDYHVKNPTTILERLHEVPHEEAAWRGEALRKHGEGKRPTNPRSQMSLW